MDDEERLEKKKKKKRKNEKGKAQKEYALSTTMRLRPKTIQMTKERVSTKTRSPTGDLGGVQFERNRTLPTMIVTMQQGGNNSKHNIDTDSRLATKIVRIYSD